MMGLFWSAEDKELVRGLHDISSIAQNADNIPNSLDHCYRANGYCLRRPNYRRRIVTSHMQDGRL